MSECNVIFYPWNKEIKVKQGTTLLEASQMAGITISDLCGGEGICGRCKMIVKEGRVSGKISGKLTRDEIRNGFVLACLTFVKSDLVIEIPRDVFAKEKRDVGEEMNRFREFENILYKKEYQQSPLVQKIYLNLDKPSLSNNIPDHQRICAAVKKKLNVSSTQTGLKIIKSIPKILRDNNYCITATVGIRADIAEMMYVEGGNTEDKNYLIAIDIGTTTIVAHLLDANAFKTLDAEACFNSQSIYGAEVTSRMISAEKKGIEVLQKLLVDDINNMIKSLAKKNEINFKDITAVVCAGNTAMGHFLLGLPICNIRRSPYIATSVEPPPLRAKEVGIQINPRGLLYSLPGISGWVGSDLTAGILATEIYKKDDISLLVDIGTNGEVIVGNKEWLIACSASAGPAFEGASIECGMRADKGAVEKVFANSGKICYDTIGKESPKGICGSGIIDLVSVLLRENIINRSGKFIKSNSGNIETINGINSFILTDKSDGNGGKKVYISESDIENLITAKAAIFAAMKIVLQRVDLQFNDIEHFYIAGAFGRYIDIDNAITIGLIPNIKRNKVEFVGNTSINGAKIVAFYRETFDKIIEIEKNTTYYDLMGANDYIEEFTKAMFLPHTDIEAFQVGSF